MKSCYDIVVVGAGPAGSTAAYVAAANGLSTLLVEEHFEVGVPQHCTGKLPIVAFREFNLPESLILNTVNAASFYSPQCERLTLKKTTAEAHIIDRNLHEKVLAELAESGGAELSCGSRVTAIGSFKNGRRLLKIKGNNSCTVEAHLVIDAEGANAQLASDVLERRLPGSLMAVQADLVDCNFEDGMVEVYLGRQYAPGFFGWLVPLGERRVRIGVAVNPRYSNTPPINYLKKLMKTHPVLSRKIADGRITKVFGGMIPLHGPLHKPYDDGFIVVGDAAGQTKSTTGGGMYFSMIAGRHAATVALEILTKQDAHAHSLAKYDQLCDNSFNRELRFTSRIRKVLDNLTDHELDLLIQWLNEGRQTRQLIEFQGDTVYQSKVFKSLSARLLTIVLMKPKGIRLLPHLLYAGFVALLP